MLKIAKDARDINRFREILTVLFEEGFHFLMQKIQLRHKIPLTKRLKAKIKEKDALSLEKRLRLTLERLGPTFIKLGQVLSVRPDLMPKSYIQELEKLQDNVPPFSYSIAREQIKKELGKEIEELFSSFEKEPIASASISQVHKATIKHGKTVAVKIQRPNVGEIMQTDVEIMLHIAKMLEKRVPKIRKFSPVKIIEEFSKWTEKELDFNKEAANAQKFGRNFAGSATVKIPEVYSSLTTSKIFTMEFVEGVELHNFKEIKRQKINLKQVINNGFEAILTQVFVHGFFHADPHPGNILITKDKKIAFVDFGIVGHFDEALKSKSIDLFYGIISNDPEKAVDALIGISGASIENEEELKYEVSDLLEPLQSKDLSSIKVSKVLEEIMSIALNYGVKVPMPFVLFGKTIITLEGIALEFDPKFSIIDASKPFIEKMARQRYSPMHQLSSLVKTMARFRKFADELPEQTSRALKKIEQGTIKVDIEDTDIKKLSVEIDKSSNRVAYSLLIAALLIVGAMTINFGRAFAFGLPIIPFISFSAALIFFLILLASILNEKYT